MNRFNTIFMLIFLGVVVGLASASESPKPDLAFALTELDRGVKQLEDRDPNARATIAAAAALIENATQLPENQSPSVYHALGNAYVLIDEFGSATLAYRRGHQIDPRDPRLNDSLEFVRSQVQTQVESNIPNRILAALVSWRGFVPRTTVWWTFIGLFGLGWCVLIVRVAKPSMGLPRMLGIWLIAGSALPLGTLIYEWSYENARVSVVITADGTRAMSGPDDSIYDPVYNEPLSGGVEGSLEESRDGWARIRLLDGTECWVPDGSFTRINIVS
jgi:hypothetical protein